MNVNERMLVEGMQSFLSGRSKLGLAGKGAPADSHDDSDPKSRGFEYMHGQIDEMFAHKAAGLVHHTGICASFHKVHSYKYLDDATFSEAMNKEMTAQGIPATERKKALEFIPKIIKELAEERDEWCERDFGFHPDLDGIMAVSQPEQYEGEGKDSDD